MGQRVRSVDYFFTTVKDVPGEALSVLSRLADAGVNLLAFNAVPVGSTVAQLTLFPENPEPLVDFAAQNGLRLTGQGRALLVQGDDQIGALVKVHRKLADARVNVYASNAVTDGAGHYAYVIHVRAEEFDSAARSLGL